jgi:NADPH-dependent glutamate synthase beta subunit-like oxidoreductase
VESNKNSILKATDNSSVEYFHKVIDCQYACPAHTPVPEYIRLIAEEKYTEAYMVNWHSNVFPGVLGRTCDRPCEPACRRGRVEEEPVAICRLKRVAADNKDNIENLLPKIPNSKNGKKIALIGGGPASLTVARDLAPLGYELELYDDNPKGGGMMRTQIPSFRLPENVLDEEVGYILGMGVDTHFNAKVNSLKSILDKKYDAVFIGTGAPKGKDLADLPGRWDAPANIHIGIEWLASVSFEHIHNIAKKVLVLGGGNTAMDCCRTARRLGGEVVTVVVRSPKKDMKASPWEIEDTLHEDIPIQECMVPLEFVVIEGKLQGMYFDKVEAVYDVTGRRSLISSGESPIFLAADVVIIAIGQENSFPWIERDLGLEFDKWGMPALHELTFASSLAGVFVGGDAALGPKNIITAVAQAHQAAISIDLHCSGKDMIMQRPASHAEWINQKMGIHEWQYENAVVTDIRNKVPLAEKKLTLANRKMEVELGFDSATAFREAQRCLNCDVHTLFYTNKCIECDACQDICPTNCITFTLPLPDEQLLREHLMAPAENTTQPLYISETLKTGKIMVKDEDVCLHCGLCAERCPTAAWEMQKLLYQVSKPYDSCPQ